MLRYELSEGTTNKFWEVSRVGASVSTTYGRIGTPGQTTKKTFDSAAKAEKAYDRLVKEKVTKGYKRPGKAKTAVKLGASDISGKDRAEVKRFLAHLDELSDEGQFPFPEHLGGMNFGGMRLHVYRGGSGYALVYEMWMHEHNSVYGKLPVAPFSCMVFVIRDPRGKRHERLWASSALPRTITRGAEPLSFSEAELYASPLSVHPAAKALRIRGKRVPIPREPAAYAKHGIKITRKGVTFEALLRLLLAEHRDQVYSTEQERKKLVPGMKLLLTLDEWRHFTLDDENPSETEALKMLAEVLISGDTKRYAPKKKPNTHWRDVDKRR